MIWFLFALSNNLISKYCFLCFCFRSPQYLSTGPGNPHFSHTIAMIFCWRVRYKNPHHAFLPMGSCRVGEYYLDKIWLMRALINNHEIRVGRVAFNRPHNVVNGSYRTKFIKGYGWNDSLEGCDYMLYLFCFIKYFCVVYEATFCCFLLDKRCFSIVYDVFRDKNVIFAV